MKKIKLLTPLLTIGLLSPTATLLAGCSKSNQTTTSYVSLDTKTCSAEQTTDENITMNTYVFNVNNFDETKNELTTEIVNIQTEDAVNIEITSTEYKKDEKKFYVYVTTSKEDGSLNDNESVKFSINFKCLNKETQEVIWEKTIDSLVVKHKSSETSNQHFVDTDVNKLFTTNTTGDQTITLTFPVGDLGKWTNKDTQDMYNIANLSVHVYRSDLAKLSKITIGDVTLNWIKTADVYTDLEVSIKINVPEDIHDALTTYNLYFEYSSPEMLVKDTWRQTIGGFRISYNTHYSGNHTELACSRNRYFYKELSSETEKATNYVVVQLLDEYASSYTANDFEVTTNNQNVVIGSEFVTYKLPDPITPTTYYYYLAIPYSLKQDQQERWFEPKDQFNVNLTITSKASGHEWSEQQRGFSFWNRLDYHSKSLVWYENRFGEDPIKTLAVNTPKSIIDKFKTVSPIDLSYVVLKEVECEQIPNISFEIDELNFEHSKVTITIPTGTTVGDYNISYTILVATECSAYKYTLTVPTKVTA